MDQESLFNHWKETLEKQLLVLPDKSEENAENTLRALWLLASGIKLSARLAVNHELPELTTDQISVLENSIRQRLSGIPLAHLTGRQNFMGLELLSDKRALIPRKETEILGDAAIDSCKYLLSEKRHLTVMDQCCGSGNLGLAVAKEIPESKVFASDLSEEAVALTNENIRFTGMQNIEARRSDLFETFESDDFIGKVDVIICNPPYISSSKVLKMEAEISGNEPSLAFDGGMIGLKVIQNLIKESPKFLVDRGLLVFEIGLGQGEFVSQLCQKNGDYSIVTTRSDVNGNIRVIVAERKIRII